MKNVVLWDIKTQFLPHRTHITSRLQSSVSQCYVRFEVFMAVTMKNVVFWDVMPCGSCDNACLEGKYRLHHQGNKNRRARSNVSCKNLLKILFSVRRLFHSDDGGDTFLQNFG
jgi:hypothetical protein